MKNFFHVILIFVFINSIQILSKETVHGDMFLWTRPPSGPTEPTTTTTTPAPAPEPTPAPAPEPKK